MCERSLMDQQSMQLKQLEDAKRDEYMANVRNMTQAAASTNMQQLGEKQSCENAWRQYEANRDVTDMNKVNSTALNPSATLSAGTTG